MFSFLEFSIGQFSIKNNVNVSVVQFIFILFFFLNRNFYVVVVPLKRASGPAKNLESPDEMDMEEVLACKRGFIDVAA